MPVSGTQVPVDVLGEWKAAWKNAAFRLQMVVTVPMLVLVLGLFSVFLEWVEERPGTVLRDPILTVLPVYDFTWPIFIIIYAGLVIGLVTLGSTPVRFLTALQSYLLMVSIRFVAMYAVPLDPPAGIIPLADPFVQFFGSGRVPTRDLFFSGHISTLLLLSFTAGRWKWKAFFAVCALAVGVLIVWQHVHYVLDVLVAPFVAYACFRTALFFQRQCVVTGNNP